MWSLVEADHNAAFKLLKTHDLSWDAVMLSEENKELTTSEEHGNRVAPTRTTNCHDHVRENSRHP